eukprot:scaffold28968_cov120-Isochrysis_galbana.AAC.2
MLASAKGRIGSLALLAAPALVAMAAAHTSAHLRTCTSQAADTLARLPVLLQSEGWETGAQATPRWPIRTSSWCVTLPAR